MKSLGYFCSSLLGHVVVFLTAYQMIPWQTLRRKPTLASDLEQGTLTSWNRTTRYPKVDLPPEQCWSQIPDRDKELEGIRKMNSNSNHEIFGTNCLLHRTIQEPKQELDSILSGAPDSRASQLLISLKSDFGSATLFQDHLQLLPLIWPPATAPRSKVELGGSGSIATTRKADPQPLQVIRRKGLKNEISKAICFHSFFVFKLLRIRIQLPDESAPKTFRSP